MKTITELFAATPGQLSEAELQEMGPTLVGQTRLIPKGAIGARGMDSCQITAAVVTGQSITLTLRRPSGETFQMKPL